MFDMSVHRTATNQFRLNVFVCECAWDRNSFSVPEYMHGNYIAVFRSVTSIHHAPEHHIFIIVSIDIIIIIIIIITVIDINIITFGTENGKYLNSVLEHHIHYWIMLCNTQKGTLCFWLHRAMRPNSARTQSMLALALSLSLCGHTN